MPTKRLPVAAHFDHLRAQAKDLLRAVRAGSAPALARVLEFHPRGSDVQARFGLSDAQLTLAREYGYASWPRLKAVLASRGHAELALIHNERIVPGPFARALDFMDAGEVDVLAAHLAAHPGLVAERVRFEGENYFTHPTLLEFVPENPVRQGRCPPNAVAVAEVLLAAGATAVTEALDLAASGRVCRESGVQVGLIRLFCAHGAELEAALEAAAAHGEFQAVEVLLECGAVLSLPIAAAMGREADVARLVAGGGAGGGDVQLALALAAAHGRAGCAQVLLEAGADPNLYNPPGGHSHCTALHSAAIAGHGAVVAVLLDAGARADVPDLHHGATALGWARHGGDAEVIALLEAL